jgi:hypothetical protein
MRMLRFFFLRNMNGMRCIMMMFVVHCACLPCTHTRACKRCKQTQAKRNLGLPIAEVPIAEVMHAWSGAQPRHGETIRSAEAW